MVKKSYHCIFITGTPGTGKTTLAKSLASSLNYHHVDISRAVKKRHLYNEWDDKFDVPVLSKSKLRKVIKAYRHKFPTVIDFHSPQIMRDKDIDLCICLHSDISQLKSRLKKRSYSDDKITENLQCEMFSISEEASRRRFPNKPFMLLNSNNEAEIEINKDLILSELNKYHTPKQ